MSRTPGGREQPAGAPGPAELSSGQLARRTGVHVETLRYYERRGLLEPPPRTAAGYRVFPAVAADRVRRIKAAQRLGFTLDEIAALIDGRPDGTVGCAELTDRLAAKLVDLDAALAELHRLRDVVASLAGGCCGNADASEATCRALDDDCSAEPPSVRPGQAPRPGGCAPDSDGRPYRCGRSPTRTAHTPGG